VTAVNVTLGYVGGADEPFEYTIRTIGVWDAILRRNADNLVKVYTAADISEAEKSGKIGIIYGFQNAAMMGADASRAGIFADLGVRVIQLTYNPTNQIGHGCMSAEDGGLTQFGREVVDRLNANQIMVDLSHSGTQTCLDAARASTAPISINHTGCRALTDLPRNKSDGELRLVASRGGFVGIYFMPFLKSDGHPNADDVAAHIDHAVNVCGEDHVGIGTDGSATPVDDLGTFGAYLAKQVEDRRKSGLGATGERADSYPFVVDLRGVGQFRKLSQLLKARGHPEARIEKILGLNFLRFARDVWGA
jgi:membrane dipeptidase